MSERRRWTIGVDRRTGARVNPGWGEPVEVMPVSEHEELVAAVREIVEKAVDPNRHGSWSMGWRALSRLRAALSAALCPVEEEGE